jgi:hypothetical protein
MINPTQRDLSKLVQCRLENGRTVMGHIEAFDVDNIVVATREGPITMPRRRVYWPGEGSSAAAAARQVFEAAGLSIEVVDEHLWTVAASAGSFRFWPETGLWRWPDGRLGGGGPRQLILAAAGKIQGQD